MFQAAEFWVALATIIFAVFAFRPGAKAVTAMLDDRADKIRQELEEAQRLREDAQATLASYQRRQRDALKEAEDIIAHAREEAERLRLHSTADLEAAMKRRETQAMDKIAQAEALALAGSEEPDGGYRRRRGRPPARPEPGRAAVRQADRRLHRRSAAQPALSRPAPSRTNLRLGSSKAPDAPASGAFCLCLQSSRFRQLPTTTNPFGCGRLVVNSAATRRNDKGERASCRS